MEKNNLSTKHLMFQALFCFSNFLKTLCKFLQRILQEVMKKVLGTSDAWSMRRSSQRPSDPAYYIEDCRISGRNRTLWNSTIYMKCGRNGWWQSWYVMSFFLMLSHSSLAHPSFTLVCLMLDREGPPKSRVKKCICISSQSATLRTIKYKSVYVYGVTYHRIQVTLPRLSEISEKNWST